MTELSQVTGFDAGLSGDEQIRFVLRRVIDHGGEAQMGDLYEAVAKRLHKVEPFKLDEQKADSASG